MARTFLALALVVFAAIQALAPGAPRAAAQQHTAGPVVCVPPADAIHDDAVPLQHATCGDQRCSPPEDCNTCPQDCGRCCGDHRCAPPEDCNTCPQDCGHC